MKNDSIGMLILAATISLLLSGKANPGAESIIEVRADLDGAAASVASAPPEEMRAIEKLISEAPQTVLSQTIDFRAYMYDVCDRIAKLPDEQLRHKCFSRYMESACKVDFKALDSMVPLEKAEFTEPKEYLRMSAEAEKREMERQREEKIMCLRGDVINRLRYAANMIFGYLLVDLTPPPIVEQLEPFFMVIEKERAEELRFAKCPTRLSELDIDQVENLFHFTCLKTMKMVRGEVDPQDLAAVEARFKHVVGRPIRSAEQYKADSNRRMQANIREHRKQEEANRRAREYQRKYNREHSIKVE